jgi:hypothetical protein
MLPFLLLIALIMYVAFFFIVTFIVRMALHAIKTRKFIWLLGIICFPFIGAILYFFIEEKHDYAKI